MLVLNLKLEMRFFRQVDLEVEFWWTFGFFRVNLALERNSEVYGVFKIVSDLVDTLLVVMVSL